MENFMRYKLMGSVKQIKMKPNCLPSRFDCQKGRKFKSKVKLRPAILRRRNIEILKETLSTPQIQQTAGTSAQPIKKPVEDPQQSEDFISCQSSSGEKNYMEININDNSTDSTDSTDSSTTINIKPEPLSPSSSEQRYDTNHDGTMFELEIDTNCEVKREETGEVKQKQAGEVKQEQKGEVKQEQTEELYAEHEIKQEMVIGPVVLQDVTHAVEDEDILLGRRKSRLKAQDDKTDQKEKNLIESRDKMKKEIYLKCEECRFLAVTQDSLERHKRLHDKKRRFVCDVCGYRYKFRPELQVHLKRSHKNISEIFECNICGYKTNMIFELDMHVRRFHESSSDYGTVVVFEMDKICEVTLEETEVSYADQDIKEAMVTEPVVLQAATHSMEDNELLTSSSSEQRHSGRNHDGSMVGLKIDAICDVKQEHTKELYADHEIKDEMAIGPVVLQDVTHVVEDEDILLGRRKSSRLKAQREKSDKKGTRHYFDDRITANLNIKETSTDITTKSKKNNEKSTNLNPTNKILSKDEDEKKIESVKHIKSQDEVKRESYLKCKQCQHELMTAASLERHERLHDRKRRFMCDVCLSRFKFKTELEEHLTTIHKNISAMFECSKCGYKTNMIFELNMHVKIHERK